MIRIRRVFSALIPADRDRIAQVQEIFRAHFADVAAYAEKIPALLDQPFQQGYSAMLLVAESGLNKVLGFALILHFPEINSAFLDFVAVRPGIRGGGVGSALYEAMRELLVRMRARGLYLEVLPDDPKVIANADMLKENKQRMRFYEHYGARPIVGTRYETPIGDSPAPHLIFDGLGRAKPLGRDECRKAMRVILERKYSHLVGPKYISDVVSSVIDNPVRLRPPRYVGPAIEHKQVETGRIHKAFTLVHGEDHVIHHVRERGYVERPARVTALRDALRATGLFNEASPRRFGESPIRAVHDGGFVEYLKTICEKMQGNRPVYPYVFPIRRAHRPPRELAVRAGYYCIDTFTPLDRNAYRAARGAVNVAMTAAQHLLAGQPVVYALCRPPGHHAERRVFGGFCYFNNIAIAAHRLSREGKVAILDIDFHHGNGTQDIFWQRSDVLTVSIHGHPNWSYPYFSGFADERGEGPGRGFNRNYPLPEGTGEAEYLQTLEKAAEAIQRFKPDVLAVSMGFDIMKGDPTGGFTLSGAALRRIGHRIGALSLPTLVVQEGGYSLRNLRRGAPSFFLGMDQAWGFRAAPHKRNGQ